MAKPPGGSRALPFALPAHRQRPARARHFTRSVAPLRLFPLEGFFKLSRGPLWIKKSKPEPSEVLRVPRTRLAAAKVAGAMIFIFIPHHRVLAWENGAGPGLRLCKG